jgi:serine/threonine-protein kinase
MASTVSFHPSPPEPTDAPAPVPGENELLARYRAAVEAPGREWAARYRTLRLLGTGGQGAVYFAERQGADGFTRPVALKFFSPEPYRDAEAYEEDMGRVAQVAARVARVQHDNLLDVHDFFTRGGVRVMEMEWLDGYDLRSSSLAKRWTGRASASAPTAGSTSTAWC